MEVFLLVASVILLVVMSLSLYFLILFLRGNVRQLERERNVHNLQVSELLDRLAWKDDKPYGLPARPPIVEAKDEPEPGDEHWREV